MGFKTDIVVDTAADIDLLQIVKSDFAAIGIDMDIRTMDPASWTLFVHNAHKQDALADENHGITWLDLLSQQINLTGYHDGVRSKLPDG